MGEDDPRPPRAAHHAAAIGDGRQIVLLQPRRIARPRSPPAASPRKRGWTLGREVGYQVRFEARRGRETRILVVTEGIV